MKTTSPLINNSRLCALPSIALTLGVAALANAQELITNGDFSNGLANWTQASWAGGSSFGVNSNGPTSIAAASGNYAFTGGGTYNLLQQNVSLTQGSAYRLTFLAGSKSGAASTFGDLSLRQEASNNYNSASFTYHPTDAVFASYTVDFVAGAASTGVWLRNDGGGYAAYDNVSVTAIGSVANALNYSAASGFTEITSALSGNGKVTSNAGSGGLTLRGNNTYTGGTEVTGGTLYVLGNGTLGAANGNVTITGTGASEVKLDLRNQQTRTGTITMTGQNARIITDANNSGSLVNNGSIAFGGGQLAVAVSGTGGINVTGGGSINKANTYNGATTISSTTGWYGTNTLFVDHANALGNATADLTISGGIVSLQNNTVSRSGNVTISGGQLITGTLSKSGGFFGFQGGQVDAVLAGTAGLTKNTAGNATLTGVNTFTGGTSVSTGRLIVSGNGTLGAASGNVTVTGTGASEVMLDLRNQQTRTGTITMSGQNARIITDANNSGSLVNNGSIAFGGGQLAVAVSGTGGINVTGGGSINKANTYNGATTISSTTGWYGTNTLFVDHANALGNATADLTISGGIVNLGNNTVSRSGNVTISGGQLITGTLSKSGGSFDVQGGQLDAVLAGTAGLTKSGAGTTILSRNNTYSGLTTVSAGTLAVNGSIAGEMTVASEATLQGNGTISGATTVSGNLKPGNSPGLLTFANSLTLDSTAVTTMEITGIGDRGVAYDAVDVTNALTYGGTLTLDFSGDLYTEGVYSFDLFNFGSSGGSFTSMSLAGIYGGSFTDNAGIWGLTQGDNNWSFNQDDGILTFTVIPEPNVAMVAGSLALMALLRRRRD